MLGAFVPTHANAQVTEAAIIADITPILDNSAVKPKLTIGPNETKIVYAADEWAGAGYDHLRIQVFKHVIAIVPLIFKKYADIIVLELVATGLATNARGTDETILVGYFKFSRKNAETINWAKVDPYAPDDVRKIADVGVLHPKMSRF